VGGDDWRWATKFLIDNTVVERGKKVEKPSKRKALWEQNMRKSLFQMACFEREWKHEWKAAAREVPTENKNNHPTKE